MSDALTPLLETLRRSAVERDRRGGHAAAEKDLLRRAGLLRLAVPPTYGGEGRPWPEIYGLVRRVAEVDSALAHLLAFHQLQVVTVLIYGSQAQKDRWLSRTVLEEGWWGNAINPIDHRLQAADTAGGYRLDGVKGFCSGSRGSSYLTLTARHDDGVLLGVVETGQRGITVGHDWDAIGQRQTDSGSVQFDQVFLRSEDVLRAPGSEATPFHTLRNAFAQLVLVNLFAGIASGALNEAREVLLREGRPWVASGVSLATDDPYTLQRVGDLHVQVRAAGVLADRAALQLQAAYERGSALTATQRGETALAVAEAKVVAHRAALDVSEQLFDITGARGTRGELGLDRYWRNARTHTLHDPLDYKLKSLGRWFLIGELPNPDHYG